MIAHPFIFIAGLHRSGTSVLNEILRDHPDIAGFRDTGVWEDEGQHLQTVFETARTFGGPGKFVFDARSHMDESHPLATEENSARIFAEWGAHLDLARRYALEKSPPNIVRMRFFQRLFPNARFIVLLRHPLAVAFATKKWTETSVAELLDHTLRAYEIALRDRAVLERNSPGCSLVVRFEDFAAAPQGEVDRILRFLGLPTIAVTHAIRADANERYLARWKRSRRNPLRRLVFERVPADFEARVARFGYSLEVGSEVRACPGPLAEPASTATA